MIAKTFVVLFCLAVTVLADEKYTDKYDNIDLNEILETTRLRTAYFNCVMEKGKCTPDGLELKNNLVDAIESGCKKCTDRQKKGAETVFHYIIEHDREMWNALCAKYDPDGKWRKTYEDEARKNGIIIPQD